jgi:hypothetical protein
VRRGKKGVDDGGAAKLTEGAEQWCGRVKTAWQRQSGWTVWTRGRGKRGGGVGLLERALARVDEFRKKRGAWRR